MNGFGFHSHITVVQDAWSKIRDEQTKCLEAANSDEEIAALALASQAQLRDIAQDCAESVFQLRSSMNGDIEILRSSVESIHGQLDALKRGLSSQPQERNLGVTPDILAAAVGALERQFNEYEPGR